MSNSDKEGLAYWLRWQVPVCALIIVVPTSLTSCLIKKAKAKPLFLDDLWTPCWRKINPVWLLIYRAFAFLCLAFMFEAAVALDGAFAFYFYTQWVHTWTPFWDCFWFAQDEFFLTSVVRKPIHAFELTNTTTMGSCLIDSNLAPWILIVF